jgi:hypothetical protein
MLLDEADTVLWRHRPVLLHMWSHAALIGRSVRSGEGRARLRLRGNRGSRVHEPSAEQRHDGKSEKSMPHLDPPLELACCFR